MAALVPQIIIDLKCKIFKKIMKTLLEKYEAATDFIGLRTLSITNPCVNGNITSKLKCNAPYKPY